MGRGGGAFPLDRKLRAVADGGDPRIVVVNGAEGEPASGKDDLLLKGTPHLVLDGAELAAAMIDAEQIIVCVKRSTADTVKAVFDAVRARSASRASGQDYDVVEVSSSYLTGEESALIHHLNGGPAKPTLVPPRPFERGVNDRPTLVQNVETLAQLALLARFGDEWYRGLGTAEDPGSLLVTLSGAVSAPGVYEIAGGTEIGQLITAAGGPTAPIQAFLVGGYAGTWFGVKEGLRLPLGHAAMRALGGTLGPGVVIALPEGACGLHETARATRYLAGESSGQCGPCVNGLAAIADALEQIAAGVAAPKTHEWVDYWGGLVTGRGACHHPDGADRLVSSALDVFADDVARHEQGQACAPDPANVLPVPSRMPPLAGSRR